jgi:predicted DNA-binding protein
MKRNMKAALSSSLRAEESRAADRKLDKFARADAAMRVEELAPEPPVEHTRVVRDSFTLPVDDYQLLSLLQERTLKAGVHASKSELVRAGLRALLELRSEDLVLAVQRLEKVKTGRPPRKLQTV